ncbi:MAG: hypothetical protein IPQ24_20865 [Anaeromyxobacter sp.]|nr:hypothetical protein [Anaeromyxobacter sp.]
MTWRSRIAAGWLLVALGAGAWLAGAPGVPTGEARTLADGRQVAGLLVRAPRAPAEAARGLEALSAGARRPLLAEALHGFAAEGGERLGLGPLRGARLGAVVVTALLAALLSLAAFDLAGLTGALLAPALLLLWPRQVSASLLATPDQAGALLWLAALASAARSLDAPTRLARTRAGTWTGVLTGAAAAVRPDLWTLLPLLATHWLLGRLHLWRLARRAPAPLELPADEPVESWAARLRRVPTALGAAALLGPALAALAYPWLWGAPLPRALAALPLAHGAGTPLPVNPLLLAAAAVPAPLLLLALLGLAHAAVRLLRAMASGDGRVARTEALWLLGAGVPLTLAGAGLAPRGPGLTPLVHALPVLALLGARVVEALARLAWPSRQAALAAALGLAALYPGLRAAALAFPHGASAWGELVGGAPGAAGLGWPRQDGGEAVRALLPALVAHAPPGTRVAWLGVAPEAVARYRRAGLLPASLLDAPSADQADLVVAALGGAPRDALQEAWQALGSARAEAGVYLDEVPLAQAFARAGGWR